MTNKELEDLVHKFPTKYKEGFTNIELHQLLTHFPNINMDKLQEAFTGNTCAVIDEQIIKYHCDVVTAIRCGLEGRDRTFLEWD